MLDVPGSFKDQRREFVRYLETIARDYDRRHEAKRLAHEELRESRVDDARLRQIILTP